MSDDQVGCEWVSVSSSTGLPGLSRTKAVSLNGCALLITSMNKDTDWQSMCLYLRAADRKRAWHRRDSKSRWTWTGSDHRTLTRKKSWNSNCGENWSPMDIANGRWRVGRGSATWWRRSQSADWLAAGVCDHTRCEELRRHTAGSAGHTQSLNKYTASRTKIFRSCRLLRGSSAKWGQSRGHKVGVKCRKWRSDVFFRCPETPKATSEVWYRGPIFKTS